jgi:hypothetical protein
MGTIQEDGKRMSSKITLKMVKDSLNCPPEILKEVLKKDKDDGVSYFAALNRNCPYQTRLKWLKATGRIKMPDLSKHNVQVVKDYNKPDEAWEQFKRMVQ